MIALYSLHPVWPDVEIKSSRISSKNCPKDSQSMFWLKSSIFKLSPKVTKYLGYTCKINCCPDLSKVAQSFLKMGQTRPLFSLFLSFQYTVDSKQMFNKFCRWLDSNRGPLVSEATTLPTEPQPLPKRDNCLASASCGWVSGAFLKIGQPRASFSFTFGLFKQTINFLHQINVKICPNVHPVYGAGIQTHDLLNMSHHP